MGAQETVGVYVSITGGAETVAGIKSIDAAVAQAAARQRTLDGIQAQSNRRMAESAKASNVVRGGFDALNSRTIRLASAMASLGPGVGGAGGKLLEFATTASVAKSAAEAMGVDMESMASRMSTVGAKMTPVGMSIGQLTMSLGALGAAFAIGTAVEGFIDSIDSVTGEADRLNRLWDNSVLAQRAIAKAFALTGERATTLAGAMALLSGERTKATDQWTEFGKASKDVEKILAKEDERLANIGAHLKEMTEIQLTKFNADLMKQAEASKAAGLAVSDHTTALMSRTDAMIKDDGAAARAAMQFQRYSDTATEAADVEKELAETMDRAASIKDLSSEAYAVLTDKAFGLQEELGLLKKALNETFVDKMAAANVVAQDFTGSIFDLTDRAKALVSTFSSSTLSNPGFGMSPELMASIEDQWLSAGEAQAASFKKYDDEIEAHHAESVAAMADNMVARFGEANVLWSNQFNMAVEGIVGSMSDVWKQAAQATASVTSQAGDPDLSTGAGRAAVASKGLSGSTSEQAERLQQIINQKKAENKQIGKSFKPGKGTREHLKVRADEVRELERQLNEMLGGKSSAGDRLSDRFGKGAGSDASKSALERQMERLTQEVQQTTKAVTASGFATRKAVEDGVVESRGMRGEMRRAADGAAETARGIAKIGGTSSLPDAAAPQSGRVSPSRGGMRRAS